MDEPTTPLEPAAEANPIAPASGLIPIGAALTTLAGVAGVLAVILPYANFIGGDAFRLIPVFDPDRLGASVWLGLEPLALAAGLVVLGFVGLIRPTAIGAALALGLGAALLLNHAGFLAYLFDPEIAGNAETGLQVGVLAGVLGTLGGLISIATRPRQR